MNKPRVFLFMGMSGCGKSTQAKMLRDYLEANDKDRKTLYIYVGDRMRELMNREDTYTLKLAKETMMQGKKLPNFLAVYAWSNILVEKLEENMNLVMDGSPRARIEAELFDEAFDFYGAEIVKPVYVEVGRDWVIQRMKARGRFDDTDERIKNRLNFFEKDTKPAIEYFDTISNNKVIRINGEQGIEEVHREVLQKVLGV